MKKIYAKNVYPPDIESKAPLLILGIGNPLMGDDGAGICTVEMLQAKPLPSHTDVLDGGTPGADILAMVQGYERVWLVDAVRHTGLTPGDVLHMQIDPDAFTDVQDELSLHGFNLAGTFRLASALKHPLPPMELWGIVIGNADPGIGLSPAVAAGVRRLVKQLRKAIPVDMACGTQMEG